ncbi:hypothetical protein APT_01644 [Acetobacter pasteurianus NBRC 101655]|nr:hypothetical protein APT_01644 [Acetobacter pasteurianus NBRC 101655]
MGVPLAEVVEVVVLVLRSAEERVKSVGVCFRVPHEMRAASGFVIDRQVYDTEVARFDLFAHDYPTDLVPTGGAERAPERAHDSRRDLNPHHSS